MTSETSRIEAYSDGVFSIAATLLVLDLKPPAQGLPFWQGMAAQWPGYAGFLLSFLFIGIMWINHHRLFSQIRKADNALLVTNLLLLLGVVWIPYPTSLLTASVARGQLQDAAILYNGSYLVIALLFNLLVRVCSVRGLVDRGQQSTRAIAAQYFLGPFLYALTLAATWWSVPLSLLMNSLLAVYFLLPPRVRGIQLQEGEGAH